MKGYGNNFVGGRESIDARKVPLWLSVDETYPSGCTFAASLKGTTVGAGTAVYVATMGGEATILAADAPAGTPVTGLLLEDVVITADSLGATGTIVTKGQILAKRGATISADIKKDLSSRISFVEE